MSDVKFLLQGLDPTDDHLAAIQAVFSLPEIKQCLVSVAFMNAHGVDLLLDKLTAVKENLLLFVGVRNGVTTKQAIQTLLNTGIYPYCVDTATQAYIFHPKVYIACNETNAKLIVGSANFTAGGLAKNVEASILIDLDLSLSNDMQVVTSVFTSFNLLQTNHPNNVFQITDDIDLNALVNDGILVDEATALPRIAARAGTGTQSQRRSHMRLNSRKLSRKPRSVTNHTQPPSSGPTASLGIINDNLLWRSNQLSQRDLNIPTGTNTNATGSMLLKRGDMPETVDFQHYFRNNVFSHLNWVHDTAPRTHHIERTKAKFRMIIKGIDYGVYELDLSHNSDDNSKTALQNNALTSLHWGQAKPLVAHQELLGGILCIYAPDTGSDFYTITIDIDEQEQ